MYYIRCYMGNGEVFRVESGYGDYIVCERSNFFRVGV